MQTDLTKVDFAIPHGDFTAMVIYQARPSFWRHPIKWWRWKGPLLAWVDLTRPEGGHLVKAIPGLTIGDWYGNSVDSLTCHLVDQPWDDPS